MANTDMGATDPLTAAAEAAWLRFAKGTYSITDRRIFIAGFKAGECYRRQRDKKQEQYEQEYERRYEARG